MPAGLSWPRYLTFNAVALFTMFLGAQFVHAIYRPLDDLPELIEAAKKAKNINSPEKKS